MRITKRSSNRRKRARSVVDETFDKMRNTKRCSNRRKRARRVVDESRNNEGVIEKRCCWSDLLPSELLEKIMSKLFFIDQIYLRPVCKSWRSFDNVPPPLKQMPWLMVIDYTEAGNHSWDSCKLVDPTYKETYTIDMSCINKNKNLMDRKEVEILESKYGWLLMSCVLDENLASTITHSLFLYSPFFIDEDDNIIELPVLNGGNKYIATFDLISNSSKKKKEEGFEVLVLSSDTNGTICIKTYRQGDNSWSCNKTIWNFQLCRIKCWVYSEGIFYYATRLKKESEWESESESEGESEWESEMGSYDIVRNNWTKFPTLISVQPLKKLNLIKFGGELYLISVEKYLYKFDLSKGTWESIESHDLDDRVLFIGDESSSILELDNDVQELKDQKQKVYYIRKRKIKGGGYDTVHTTVVKHCNALNQNRSYGCTKWYGSLAQETRDCNMLWIDPPRRIRNSI